jgi:alpha-tubulin suppressor-like RCC1 family protein
VYAAGYNRDGQLGLGDTDNRNTFTLVDTSHIEGNITSIATRGEYSMLLTDSGNVYATGDNRYGQLGLGDYDNRNIFTLVNTSHIEGNIASIAAGYSLTLLLTDSGNVYATGDSDNAGPVLGDNTFTLVDTPIEGKIISIVASNIPALLLTDSGKVYATGDVFYASLRLWNTFTLVDTSYVEGKITSIVAGDSYTMLLTDSGNVYAAGRNVEGQLGLGDTDNRNTFTLVDTFHVEGKITSIAIGGWYSMLLTDSGNVYATGHNFYGQLGLGDNYGRNTFTLVDTSYIDGNIASIVASHNRTFLLTDSGNLYGTGYNDHGELGVDLDYNRRKNTFTLVYTLHVEGNITAIVTGYDHTLLLTDSGNVYVAGYGRAEFILVQ